MARPITRVLAVLELLQARGQMSGSELARTLEVDGRTLRRYISMLEEMGIPITATQGRHGGYGLVPGFKLPPLMFTADEVFALSIGLLASRGIGLAEAAPAITSAQAKLERVMPARLKRRLRAVDETVSLELGRPPVVLDHAVLSLLSAAAQECKRTHIHYRTPKGEDTQRDFDPYGLVYRTGRWYAVGMCHLRHNLRSFRLDRMHSASALSIAFERPAQFDALEYLKSSIATVPRAHTVEVLLTTDLVTAQRELFFAFGVIEWIGDGVLLRGHTDDLGWYARELSRLPFDFQVRSPDALRESVAACGQRLIELSGRGAVQ